MNFKDLLNLFWSQDPESASGANGSDAAASSNASTSDTAASSATAEGLARENRTKVETVIKKTPAQALEASFKLAFQQGNEAMMEMLTKVAGYKPSPAMIASGVTLEQWRADQTKNQTAQLERQLESPAMNLPAKALAQVNAISMDMGNWMGSQSMSTLPLPTPQRSMSLGLAA